MKIILIGFMGSGKTSVAKILADKLNMQHIEMDELIIKKSGRKNIVEIFEIDGEEKFRKLELETTRELETVKNAVISPGGGFIMNEAIISYLKTNGRLIYLETSFDEIENRIQDIENRPLFKDKTQARMLYEYRKPLYQKHASVTIQTDGKTVEEVVDKVVNLL